MTMPRAPRLPQKDVSVRQDIRDEDKIALPSPSTPPKTFSPIMIYVPAALLALATALFLRPSSVKANSWSGNTPDQAVRIYPKDFAVLDTVLPVSQANITTVSQIRDCADGSNLFRQDILLLSCERNHSRFTTTSFTPSSDRTRR